MNTRALTIGTILNGKYRIESILGEGGFGITYLATDTFMSEKVAIKEYFPSVLATRDTTLGLTKEITIITGANEDDFEKGLSKFEDEASSIAKFQSIPGIISVKSFFKENNTGYMVMEYVEGITLKTHLENIGGKLPYTQAIDMMLPIMEALSIVHKEGIIHRDISPDNIMITKENRLKLIDFGAARYVNQDEKSLTVMLKEGYAPPEQYRTDGKQGPWTDIYALSATMYRMITGLIPIDSVSRVISEKEIVPINKVVKVPSYVEKAILKGMATSIEARYGTIKSMEKELENRGNKKLPPLLISAVSLVLLGVVVALLLESGQKKITESKSESITNKSEDCTVIEQDELNNDEEKPLLSDAELMDYVLKYTGKEIYQKDTYQKDTYYEDLVKEYGYYYPQFNYIIDDFDGDGYNEICALLNDKKTSESDTVTDVYLFYSNGYDCNLYLSNGTTPYSSDEQTLDMEVDSFSYRINPVQFGDKIHIEVVGYTLHLEGTEIYSVIFSVTDMKRVSGDDCYVCEGMDEHAVIVDMDTYLMIDGQKRFMEQDVYYLNGKYQTFSIDKLSESDISFENYSEEKSKAENDIRKYSVAPNYIYDCVQENPYIYDIYISDNDKLYVDYQLNAFFEDTKKPAVYEKMIAEYQINENSIKYLGIMPGEVCEDGFYPCGKNALSGNEVADIVYQYVMNRTQDEGRIGFDWYREGAFQIFRFFDNMEDHIATWLWLYVDVENGFATDMTSQEYYCDNIFDGR